jgi:hypothetical protein
MLHEEKDRHMVKLVDIFLQLFIANVSDWLVRKQILVIWNECSSWEMVVVSSGSKPENVSIIDNFIIIFEHYKLLS